MAKMKHDPMSQIISPVLACVLSRLVRKNDTKVPATTSGLLSKFHAVDTPSIALDAYIYRITKYAMCSAECFVIALIYIDRLNEKNPTFVVNSLTIHRLLITGVMLSAKFIDDHYFNNRYYAKVGGVPCSEINALEREFLFMINFDLSISTREYLHYYQELMTHVVHAHSRTLSPKEAQQASTSPGTGSNKSPGEGEEGWEDGAKASGDETNTNTTSGSDTDKKTRKTCKCGECLGQLRQPSIPVPDAGTKYDAQRYLELNLDDHHNHQQGSESESESDFWSLSAGPTDNSDNSFNHHHHHHQKNNNSNMVHIVSISRSQSGHSISHSHNHTEHEHSMSRTPGNHFHFQSLPKPVGLVSHQAGVTPSAGWLPPPSYHYQPQHHQQTRISCSCTDHSRASPSNFYSENSSRCGPSLSAVTPTSQVSRLSHCSFQLPIQLLPPTPTSQSRTTAHTLVAASPAADKKRRLIFQGSGDRHHHSPPNPSNTIITPTAIPRRKEYEPRIVPTAAYPPTSVDETAADGSKGRVKRPSLSARNAARALTKRLRQLTIRNKKKKEKGGSSRDTDSRTEEWTSKETSSSGSGEEEKSNRNSKEEPEGKIAKARKSSWLAARLRALF